MRQLVPFIIVSFTAACFAHYEPPLPSGSFAASIPVALGVVAEDAKYPDEETQEAVALFQRTGVFSTVASAPTIQTDLVVSVSRYPLRSEDDWCYGDNSFFLGFLTAGIVPGCACSSGYLMKFYAPGSREPIVFRFEHEACSWVGWIPVLWNARSDYHWYGGPDEKLEAAHLAAELAAVQEELLKLCGGIE